MPTYSTEPDYLTEPKKRFYPVQEAQPQTKPHHTPEPQIPPAKPPIKQKNDDTSYLMHRHPFLLQRLYDAAERLLGSYHSRDFIYDAYPDYVSLRLVRDRMLRENTSLTEAFLQEGCPIEWLNLLTDTVISDLLCKKRSAYRKPSGEANTTSVRSALRS